MQKDNKLAFKRRYLVLLTLAFLLTYFVKFFAVDGVHIGPDSSYYDAINEQLTIDSVKSKISGDATLYLSIAPHITVNNIHFKLSSELYADISKITFFPPIKGLISRSAINIGKKIIIENIDLHDMGELQSLKDVLERLCKQFSNLTLSKLFKPQTTNYVTEAPNTVIEQLDIERLRVFSAGYYIKLYNIKFIRNKNGFILSSHGDINKETKLSCDLQVNDSRFLVSGNIESQSISAQYNIRGKYSKEFVITGAEGEIATTLRLLQTATNNQSAALANDPKVKSDTSAIESASNSANPNRSISKTSEKIALLYDGHKISLVSSKNKKFNIKLDLILKDNQLSNISGNINLPILAIQSIADDSDSEINISPNIETTTNRNISPYGIDISRSDSTNNVSKLNNSPTYKTLFNVFTKFFEYISYNTIDNLQLKIDNLYINDLRLTDVYFPLMRKSTGQDVLTCDGCMLKIGGDSVNMRFRVFKDIANVQQLNGTFIYQATLSEELLRFLALDSLVTLNKQQRIQNIQQKNAQSTTNINIATNDIPHDSISGANSAIFRNDNTYRDKVPIRGSLLIMPNRIDIFNTSFTIDGTSFSLYNSIFFSRIVHNITQLNIINGNDQQITPRKLLMNIIHKLQSADGDKSCDTYLRVFDNFRAFRDIKDNNEIYLNLQNFTYLNRPLKATLDVMMRNNKVTVNKFNLISTFGNIIAKSNIKVDKTRPQVKIRAVADRIALMQIQDIWRNIKNPNIAKYKRQNSTLDMSVPLNNPLKVDDKNNFNNEENTSALNFYSCACYDLDLILKIQNFQKDEINVIDDESNTDVTTNNANTINNKEQNESQNNEQNDQVLNNLYLNLLIDQGNIMVKKFDIGAFGGTLTGDFLAQVFDVIPNFYLYAKLRNVNLAPMLSKIIHVNAVDGICAANLKIGGKGQRFIDVIHSLNGEAKFKAKNVKIDGFDLQAVVYTLGTNLPIDKQRAIINNSLYRNISTFDEGSGSITIQNGVASLKQCNFFDDRISAAALANISLYDNGLSAAARFAWRNLDEYTNLDISASIGRRPTQRYFDIRWNIDSINSFLNEKSKRLADENRGQQTLHEELNKGQ